MQGDAESSAKTDPTEALITAHSPWDWTEWPPGATQASVQRAVATACLPPAATASQRIGATGGNGPERSEDTCQNCRRKFRHTNNPMR